MRIKTSDLIGPALNWAVAKCEIPNDIRDNKPRFWLHPNNPKLVCHQTYNHVSNPKGYELCLYSTDWAQGGPIIERERITLDARETDWKARIWSDELANFVEVGVRGAYCHTPLIAAMRCYVASKLGDTVDIPEELLK